MALRLIGFLAFVLLNEALPLHDDSNAQLKIASTVPTTEATQFTDSNEASAAVQESSIRIAETMQPSIGLSANETSSSENLTANDNSAAAEAYLNPIQQSNQKPINMEKSTESLSTITESINDDERSNQVLSNATNAKVITPNAPETNLTVEDASTVLLQNLTTADHQSITVSLEQSTTTELPLKNKSNSAVTATETPRTVVTVERPNAAAIKLEQSMASTPSRSQSHQTTESLLARADKIQQLNYSNFLLRLLQKL